MVTLQAIETALASADDLSTAIHVSDQQLRAVDGEPIDREGQGKQFAGATRHMAYCFTSATDPSDWASASNTRERVVAAVPSSAELETNLPYDHFVARLRAQMRAQDQLLPAAKIDAIVREVVRVVLAQNATTVNAIRSHFYESEIQANQAQEVRWQQANNQATQVQSLTQALICVCAYREDLMCDGLVATVDLYMRGAVRFPVGTPGRCDDRVARSSSDQDSPSAGRRRA